VGGAGIGRGLISLFFHKIGGDDYRRNPWRDIFFALFDADYGSSGRWNPLRVLHASLYLNLPTRGGDPRGSFMKLSGFLPPCGNRIQFIHSSLELYSWAFEARSVAANLRKISLNDVQYYLDGRGPFGAH
jgi:hypothetical protein